MKRLLVCLLLVGVVGCKSSPLLEQSDFYKACAQWAGEKDTFHTVDEIVFDGKSVRDSGGRSRETLHQTLTVITEVSSKSEGIDQFMRGLHAKLKKLAQQTGAPINSQDPDGMNGQVREFNFQYTAGIARGKVEAVLEATENQSSQVDMETYKLILTIEESVD
tara:strand:+ start:247 stop:735 length:489 start_codon:yes stop_codon:yes gene_type:complete